VERYKVERTTVSDWMVEKVNVLSKIVDPPRVDVLMAAFTELPDIVEYDIGFVVRVEAVILDRSRVLP
jgi:hypothetical protein